MARPDLIVGEIGLDKAARTPDTRKYRKVLLLLLLLLLLLCC